VCAPAVLFIFNFVVPNLQSLFADATELPWYTTMLLESSAFMRQWQWFVFAGLAALGLALLARTSQSVGGRLQRPLDADMPILRDASTMVERIRFANGLGMMLEADCRSTVRSRSQPVTSVTVSFAAKSGRRLRKSSAASSFQRLLRETRMFPDYYASLLEVGEESGELARVFTEIARRSRAMRYSAWALRLTTLLEPMLILIMGLIVGGVVVVMMLSVASVSNVGV
jgi:general secretion pathway protein F